MSHLQCDLFPVKAHVDVFICQVREEDQRDRQALMIRQTDESRKGKQADIKAGGRGEITTGGETSRGGLRRDRRGRDDRRVWEGREPREADGCVS